MSASDKKKLRAAERAEKMTERQLAEQKEAKKLKLFTTAFVVVLALMVCFAAYIGISKTIENSGIREKNTVALTIGDHEINNVELNYYFVDSVNQFANTYGSYASLFGLDLTKPLDEQVVSEETGTTWADDFMTQAVDSAKSVYALCDEAEANGFTLSDKDKNEIELAMENTAFYAMYYYGYSTMGDFLKAMYGPGSTEESYREYYTMTYTADAYGTKYTNDLVYEDADLREAEAENYSAYSNFTYNYYYLNAEKFLADPDNTEYTEEEYAKAVSAAEKAAKSLTNADITDAAALDAAIAALEINAEVENAASTASSEVAYSGLNSVYADWIADSARKAGDLAYFARTSTSTDEAGNETTKTDGFYVVMFNGRNDNNFPLINIRHILVAFEGGTTDSTTGETVYSDTEKAAARTEAEELFNQWKSGEATEESFAALANEKSDDGDGTTGGLYENVYPGQMVTNFNDWCFDESRKAGDTGIVETEYGYHIMYYSGDSDVLYRDYMIENDLRNADATAWYTALIEGVTSELKNPKFVRTDLVMSNG